MKEFDEIIQQKAIDHEAQVPTGAREYIFGEKKKRRFVIFWWLLPLLMGGAGFWFYIDSSNTKSIHQDTGTSKIIETQNDRSGNSPVTAEKSPANIPNGHVEKETNLVPDSSGHHDKKHEIVTNQSLPVNPENTQQQPIKSLAENAPSQMHKNANRLGAKNKNFGSKAVQSKQQNKVVETVMETSVPDENATNNLVYSKKVKGVQKGRTHIEVIAPATSNDSSTLNVKLPEQTNSPNPTPAISQSFTNDSTAEKAKMKQIARTVQQVPDSSLKAKKHDPKKKSEKYPWSVELSISPAFGMIEKNAEARFARSYFSNQTQTDFVSAKAASTLQTAMQFGLHIRKKITKRITVGTGLDFIRIQEKIKISGKETNTHFSYINVLVDGPGGPSLVPDTVYAISEGARSIQATNSYQLISIPILLQYNFFQHPKWVLGITGGADLIVSSSYNNAIDEQSPAPLTRENVNKPDTKKMLANIHSGIRIERMLARRLSFALSPSIRWNIPFEDVKNSLFNKKSNLMIVGFSLNYKF